MSDDKQEGTERKPITQELRKYLKDADILSDVGIAARARILDLCANIDAINEALEDEYAEMRTFVESLDDAAKKHEDLTLWGADYMALPLDADDVPIHVGDVMESKVGGPLFGEGSFEVRAMRCDEYGWEVYDRLGERCAPSLLRHHHEPTVEDVLWEFTRTILNQKVECREQNIAKYAAKLRLAESEDA